MFWADKIVDEIERRYSEEIKEGKTIIVRDEKTASGRVHVGSLRSASLHGIVADILSERGISNTFHFEINDFDPMDGLPPYLDEKEYLPHMGKPLYTIPSPDGKAENFAEFYGLEYVKVLKEIGFEAEVYRASELYLEGKMNDVIRLALENAEIIRRIYKEVSGSIKGDDWLPISVICKKCGKVGTTRATSFDSEKVVYTCEPKMVKWAEGCGHSGSISPFDGNAKLPFKVDWAAKFKVMGVHFEGAGKDHYTKGGTREVVERISREVFSHEPPYGVANEFFLIGGKKMSSSKGSGVSAREIADMLPVKILRLVLLGKDINRQVNFDPEGDTIPLLYDNYDRIAQKYWEEVNDDDTRLFQILYTQSSRGSIPKMYLPRFSQVVFLVQMQHMDFLEEVEKLKGEALSEGEKREALERAEYAKRWLNKYAKEEYKYELKEKLPIATNEFTEEQRKALQAIYNYVVVQDILEGQELHTKLHEIRKGQDIDAKDFFSALYISFLGKGSGPKAGWFLSVLDKDFIERRLKEASRI